MLIWQADFYKRQQMNQAGEILWELLITDSLGKIIYERQCPQSMANSDWLLVQLQQATEQFSPDVIQVFRPQSLALLTSCAEKLGLTVVATRRTWALKKVLQQRAAATKDPQDILDKPPPQPLPANLWGEEWRFAHVAAGDLIEFFKDRPIPLLNIPEELLPINLGLASTLPIPGMVIYGGRTSMYLARWLNQENPVAINYISTEVGKSGGLVLESGLVNRWILATFEDPEVVVAAEKYEQRKQLCRGLHFLTIQPDSSGMTYSGFWLLQEEYSHHLKV
ncbi:Tab2/Atab2 family RNA-binding protein [Gloeothece verrucosa]|uniref:DUF1092 family protein n=1 Tax=Gloeothece verrucosa (strain PCC 7822) TaxID=497965 RepID=E0U5C0_GLOV7|nr:Tab2/Atab2 family RNA-binding protein [Gloeothece verrucosa]ADN13510.1 protein of unknown function DUF1092 [Gloeothece verrucosa PCC 7822]